MLAAAHGGTHRVSQHTLYGRVLFLQILHNARIGAAAARARHEVIHLAIEVAPDLRAGGLVVGQRVRGVVELPQRDRAGDRRAQKVGLCFRAKHAALSGRVDDLRAKRPHQGLLLLAELCRHHEDHPVAPVQRREGDAQAGIARSGLHDGAAGPDESVPLRLIQHIPANAILHAARRVHQLQLGVQVHTFRQIEVVQLYQRRVADHFLGGLIECHN